MSVKKITLLQLVCIYRWTKQVKNKLKTKVEDEKLKLVCHMDKS